MKRVRVVLNCNGGLGINEKRGRKKPTPKAAVFFAISMKKAGLYTEQGLLEPP